MEEHLDKFDIEDFNNLRFKYYWIATYYSGEGFIKVSKRFGKNVVYLIDRDSNLPMATLGVDEFKEVLKTKSFRDSIRDFEIIVRDAETFKDFQVGDVVNNVIDGSVPIEIIFRSHDLVVGQRDLGLTHKVATGNLTCEELFDSDYRLELTEIEKYLSENN